MVELLVVGTTGLSLFDWAELVYRTGGLAGQNVKHDTQARCARQNFLARALALTYRALPCYYKTPRLYARAE